MITKYTSVNFVSNDFLARIAILRLRIALLGLRTALLKPGNAILGLSNAIRRLSGFAYKILFAYKFVILPINYRREERLDWLHMHENYESKGILMARGEANHIPSLCRWVA